MNARLALRLARPAAPRANISDVCVTARATRAIAIAAAAGDVTAIGIQYVHQRWIISGIDLVDERAGMQVE